MEKDDLGVGLFVTALTSRETGIVLGWKTEGEKTIVRVEFDSGVRTLNINLLKIATNEQDE